MGQLVEISVDLLLVGRVLVACLWGILFAVFLQYHRLGRFLVEARTWVTVVLGVGVDLALAYGGDWWTVFFVVGASAVGILVRSWANESRRKDSVELGAYQRKWILEDAIADGDEAIMTLRLILRDKPEDGRLVVRLSETLELLQSQRGRLKAAREGRFVRRQE